MKRVFVRILPSVLCAFVLCAQPLVAQPSKADYLEIAKKGWVFDLRSSLLRRDPELPPVRFDSKEVVSGQVCLFGAEPHPLSLEIITAFDHLLAEIFGTHESIGFVGSRIDDCPPSQRVYLRIYSGDPPFHALNSDLRYLDRIFGIGLPQDRIERVRSPAQAIGFFGRSGSTAHMMIQQSDATDLNGLEREYYSSILVEELFQVFSNGVDVLKFDRDAPFISKLQEYPTNLRHLPWRSEAYMRGLVESNPKGLCAFDVFMLHALAVSELDTSNSVEFLDFIEDRFGDLVSRASATLANPAFKKILGASCVELPETGGPPD